MDRTVRRPAVFLDRDGTLIEDKGFLGDPEGVVILPTVADALRLLQRHGYAAVVISNQSGIARGFLAVDDVRAVNAEIERRLAAEGVRLDGWYWCAHAEDGCACRKPAPGLVHQAVADHDIAIAGGAVIGDRGSDVALGHGLGVPGILVPGPYPYAGPEPELRAQTLLEAAEWIVARG